MFRERRQTTKRLEPKLENAHEKSVTPSLTYGSCHEVLNFLGIMEETTLFYIQIRVSKWRLLQ